MAKRTKSKETQHQKALEFMEALQDENRYGKGDEQQIDLNFIHKFMQDCPDGPSSTYMQGFISHYEEGDEIWRSGSLGCLTGAMYLEIRRNEKVVHRVRLAVG